MATRDSSLIDRLNELGDLEALPTSVTFFLVRLKKGTAAGLKQYLWDRHGLLIRDASNFRSLDETYIRISHRQQPRTKYSLMRYGNGFPSRLDIGLPFTLMSFRGIVSRS